MPLLGRISSESGHSVVPFVCPLLLPLILFLPCFPPSVCLVRHRSEWHRSFSLVLYFLFFNLFTHLCPRPQGNEGNIPRPFCSFPFSAPLLHIASPPSLYIVSLQSTCCYSLCSMILFHTHLPIFGCCLRGFAPSVMLNLLHSLIFSLLHSSNAHALSLTCAALCLLCLARTFVY